MTPQDAVEPADVPWWPGVEVAEEHHARALIREAEVLLARETYARWLEAVTGLPVVRHKR